MIGEHTDYNGGLGLPFAIREGVYVKCTPTGRSELTVNGVHFPLRAERGPPHGDWRDFVRGAIGELLAAGVEVAGADLTIESDLPQGAGLASSAALTVALCLAIGGDQGDRIGLARLCSRVENDWVGARTGLLDQLASLLATEGHAVRIDFRPLDTRQVPLQLGRWRLSVVDSGERRTLASSGYNERRAECERACQLLGVESLRQVDWAADLPPPLERRVRHVIEENDRVDATIAALERGDLAELASCVDASHASLRDLYDASTPAVERTVARLKAAGAAGARMIGGGFGGQVLALFPPGAAAVGRVVAPGAGARVLAT